MYCSKCGSWVVETDTACSHCGTPRRPDAAPIPLAVTPEPPRLAPTTLPEPLTPPPVPLPLPVPRYAGFWRRFVTMWVDALVAFPFGLAVRILLGVGVLDSIEWNRDWALVLTFDFTSSWLYAAFMESSRWQGTLGQQLLGIRVTDRRGRRVSFARATGRHFAQLLSVATAGIGYLMVAFHPRKQALHDLVAGCLLVSGGLEAPALRHEPRPVPGPTLSPLGGAGL